MPVLIFCVTSSPYQAQYVVRHDVQKYSQTNEEESCEMLDRTPVR